MAPKIDRTNLNKVRIKAGQSFNFDVKVAGEPPPTITWSLKDKPVQTSERVRVQTEDYNTKLNVRQATRADSGLYSIKAENRNGTDIADVEVIVLGEFSICFHFRHCNVLEGKDSPSW